MSGGHFDYEDAKLVDLADILENDIAINNTPDEHGYCLRSTEETLKYAGTIEGELRRLAKLLHEYDWYVSGDTSEEEFLRHAREYYGRKK